MAATPPPEAPEAPEGPHVEPARGPNPPWLPIDNDTLSPQALIPDNNSLIPQAYETDNNTLSPGALGGKKPPPA